MTREKAVVICSGGMDSVTLAYLLAGMPDPGPDDGNDLLLVSFDYGQRHKKELTYAMLCAEDLRVPHIVINIDFVTKLFGGSALTDDIDVPEGHYAADNMKQTVVPNRNMMMLSIATGLAVAKGANFVATGVHAGDHPVYPDCRPEFIRSIDETARLATEGFALPEFQIVAPFVNISKADICKKGAELGVPLSTRTWSCYKGGAHHCGRCGTCVERKEAFRLAEVYDYTPYDDPNFEIEAYRDPVEAQIDV